MSYEELIESYQKQIADFVKKENLYWSKPENNRQSQGAKNWQRQRFNNEYTNMLQHFFDQCVEIKEHQKSKEKESAVKTMAPAHPEREVAACNASDITERVVPVPARSLLNEKQVHELNAFEAQQAAAPQRQADKDEQKRLQALIQEGQYNSDFVEIEAAERKRQEKEAFLQKLRDAGKNKNKDHEHDL